jgi:general secretion pathway protein G
MNMLRKGFTLIELLIVITIIAILAGAAIPYVQDYVEESRYSRAKQDLDEIKNAMVRWGVEKGAWAGGNTINPLVGPYLTKSLADPWGSQYFVNDASSTIQSYGPDRAAGGGDDVIEPFRPPLALTRCYYLDVNDDGLISTGDSLHLKFTRPIAWTGGNFEADELDFTDTTTLAALGTTESVYSGFGASMGINVTTAFKPGLSTFTFTATCDVADKDGNLPRVTSNTIQLR